MSSGSGGLCFVAHRRKKRVDGNKLHSKKTVDAIDLQKKRRIGRTSPAPVQLAPQEIKITVVHELRMADRSIAAFVDNDQTRKESEKLVEETKRLEEVAQLRSSPAHSAVPVSTPSLAASSAPRLANDNLFNLDELTSLVHSISQPAGVLRATASLFSAAHAQAPAAPLIDNHDDDGDGAFPPSLFADYREPLFEEFNNAPGMSFLDQPRAPVAAAAAGARRSIDVSSLIANNVGITSFAIENEADAIDIQHVLYTSFQPIVELDDEREHREARDFCSLDRARAFDFSHTFGGSESAHLDRQRAAMAEESIDWAQAHRLLDRHGNAMRVANGPLWVGEKTERMVRCSRFRKHFFRPRVVGANNYCGMRSALNMIEHPQYFLLPSSEMWSDEMRDAFAANDNGAFGEFVEYERARCQVMWSAPVVVDEPWQHWRLCADLVAKCHPRAFLHAEVVDRLGSDVEHSPNVRHFSGAGLADLDAECRCAFNGTVVLCCKPTHQHTVRPLCSPAAGQRAGADCQSVVAAEVFGPASRERWIKITDICSMFEQPRHSVLLVDTFLAAMEADRKMCQLLPCLLEFGVKEPHQFAVGKPHDPKLKSNAPPAAPSGHVLPHDSHGHERFAMYDPIQLTLALLLFVETRMTVGWFNAWRVWVAAVLAHCQCCPFCSNRFTSSLYRLVVYNALLPVLPVTMSVMLEQLAGKTRCNREQYRY